jgi:hypothetical protein
MSRNAILKWTLLIVVISILTFFSHVFVQGWIRPILPGLAEGMQPEPPGIYPNYIVALAFATAIIQIALNVLVYYYAGHLLAIQNKILKSLALTAIILELNGALIRYTVVGSFELARLGAAHPVLYILADNLDKWIPNLILAFGLVYFCPLKTSKTVAM